ncbi:MAG: hypothetical protein ABFR82_08765 [Nitrospirota bacterium]
MEEAGYPSFVLYLILLIGIPLALNKPFKAFLLVTFILASANAHAFTFTRTEFLGPFFNANDACLLIVLIAMLPYKFRRTKQIQFPKVTIWIIVVLLIGFVQSWFVMGPTYEALRALRWAINLPVYFIIAATMVDRKEKVWPLLLALFFGSALSAIEHFFFVQEKAGMYGMVFRHIRTIAFQSPGVFFVVASLIWIPKLKEKDKLLLIGGCVLFVISILLNQTRSVWLSTVAVFPIALLVFKQKNIDVKLIVLPIVIVALFFSIFIVTALIAPELDLFKMVMERFLNVETSVSTIKRLGSLKLELLEWSGGTLIFGRGLSYFDKYGQSVIELISWGHLGHVTTLAQLGIIGLVVYSFYLPATIIKSSRKLWEQATDEIKFLALLTGSSMIWYWICFLMSSSFLGQYPLAGIMFGAVWRQSTLIETDRAVKKRKYY